MTEILYTLTVPAFNTMRGALIPIFASLGGQAVAMDGTRKVRDVVIASVYLKLSMTCAILRHSGLVIGKNDFVGPERVAQGML